MTGRVQPTTVRRILAAEGYLELGMPLQAERELAQIPAGTPLEGPRQFLRGHVCRLTNREEEATKCFRASAHHMPPPVAMAIWSALHDAYRSAGAVNDARAAYLHGAKAAAQVQAAVDGDPRPLVIRVPGGTLQITFSAPPPSDDAA